MNVYDWDKTIFDGDCTAKFYLFEIRRNPLLLRYCLKQLYGFARYYVFKNCDKTVMKGYFYSYLKSVKDVEKEVDLFWEKNIDKIYPYYLKNQQSDDVIISASAQFMVEPACKKLGIKNVIASQVDPKTGKVLGKNNSNSQKIESFKEAGYKIEEMENFYSDSFNDTPLAKLAKKAYLIKKGEVTDWPL